MCVHKIKIISMVLKDKNNDKLEDYCKWLRASCAEGIQKRAPRY